MRITITLYGLSGMIGAAAMVALFSYCFQRLAEAVARYTRRKGKRRP